MFIFMKARLFHRGNDTDLLQLFKILINSNKNSKLLWKNLSLLFLIFFLFSGSNAFAKIDSNWSKKNQIDLEALKITKQQLFSHIEESILQEPSGLGNFGRISIKLCSLEIKGQRLSDLSTRAGRKIQYLSNPSCSLILIEKLLHDEYKLRTQAFSKYEKRKCFLTVEKIISPLLEFYSIQFEEKQTDCSICESLERSRLAKILDLREKIGKNCNQGKGKVIKLIDDLDQLIEKTYREKTKK